MAEATLYMWTARGMFPAPDPSSRGGWRRNSDYARLLDRVAELERERDELAEQLATLQTDAFDERQEERAELARLRAVEAAATHAMELLGLSSHPLCRRSYELLAEACGRKG